MFAGAVLCWLYPSISIGSFLNFEDQFHRLYIQKYIAKHQSYGNGIASIEEKGPGRTQYLKRSRLIAGSRRYRNEFVRRVYISIFVFVGIA